jgi:hypothetical protein
MEHRRRVPRQPAGWRGLCLVEGETATGWHDCRVIDISTLGLGITLHYPVLTELMGRGLSVEVPALNETVKIRFEGTIKNVAAPVAGGVVRIGIEFPEHSEASQPMTAVVSLMSKFVTHASTA